jgi:integrase
MSSLAGYLRRLAESGVYDFEDIIEKYETWVLDHRYMVMAHLREDWLSDPGEYEYVAVKCAKRGNDVYVSRVDSRLCGLGLHVPNVDFDLQKNPYTNILFIALTYDTKLCSFAEAWRKIGKEFNLWKANIRKKFGDFSVFRCFEAFENGHPHIHLIAVFKEQYFKVFKSYKQAKDGKMQEVWLVEEKEFFEPYWHSWTKIKAVYNLKGGLNYLKKYIMKCAEYQHNDRKGKITLAMCWVFRKMAWCQLESPKYKFQRKIPWLPTEAQLDQLIAGCKPRLATFLQILKETMARAGEAWALKWTDINGNILTINAPEKGSKPRQFKISNKLVSMINALPMKDERIFGPNTSLANFRTNYLRRRKQIARTLAEPRITKITFHTFRHWGATMLFHKTKNILYVQQQLGHRCIENTIVYTQLINFGSDE